MKKALLITSILLLILTGIQITKSFGLFQSEITGDADINIAKWHIKVNNYNLNDTNNVFYVDNITYINNENVTTNRFAPGVTGSFIIEIDPTDTEVSFKYDLNIDLSDSQYSQIRIDSIEGVNGTNLTVEDNVYSRVFLLNEIKENKKDNIKVTFTWINEEENNDSDSELGSSDGNFEIPVNIKFSQYVG